MLRFMHFPRLALILCLLGSATLAPGEDARANAERNLAAARLEVAEAPKNGDAHVRLAIALGKMTDFTDNRTKMTYARQIREEAETGLRLNPENSDGCLVLGKWHDEMSRLNPVLRAIAAAIYGKLPEASFVEAERYLREAIRVAPGKIRPHAELAAFLGRRNRPAESRREWQKILTLPPQDAEDRAFFAEARRHLP